MNNIVREYLINVARKNNGFVHYSQLVKDCKLDYNLSTENGKKQLSETLAAVSIFENENKRPLLSSLVIYKDTKKNDHGPGFYKLAEELGKGNKRKLVEDLYGFSEANECIKYWSNQDHYNKESLNSSLINLYNNLITKNHWVESWKDTYINFVNEIKTLRENINHYPNLSISDSKLYINLSSQLASYEDFMYKFLKEKSNGISSRGQSVLSEKDFKLIIHDDNFKIIIKTCINTPSVSSYNLLQKWWFENNEINNRPLLINRVFAALNYKDLSSTVHDQKFWNVVSILSRSYSFEFKQNHNNNWFSANQELCEWIDSKLSSQFTNSKNNIEYYILRNIFIWLVFEEFHSSSTLLPNQLIKKDMSKKGFDNIPHRKRSFKGSQVDYLKKNKADKDLGDAGEELVKQYEKKFLIENNLITLSEQVEIVIDGMGYDILSFDKRGNQKFIEVKTTTGDAMLPFFISENEFEFMKLNKGSYSIYRVYDYDEENNSGLFYEIVDDVESQLLMHPTSFKVYKKK